MSLLLLSPTLSLSSFLSLSAGPWAELNKTKPHAGLEASIFAVESKVCFCCN